MGFDASNSNIHQFPWDEHNASLYAVCGVDHGWVLTSIRKHVDVIGR